MEYALLVSGIAAIIVVMIVFFGDNVVDIFSETCDSVAGANAPCRSD